MVTRKSITENSNKQSWLCKPSPNIHNQVEKQTRAVLKGYLIDKIIVFNSSMYVEQNT